MPSPFPGMDPYLEAIWQGVHTVLVADSWRHLNRQLPDGLVACVEERVGVELDPDGVVLGLIGPDVRASTPELAPTSPATVVLDDPFELEPAAAPPVERYVSVVDAEGRLITVVEFVSPANKRRPGITRFRQNRLNLLAAGVHFVEVDLVRAGNWRRLMWPEGCPVEAESTYRTVVRTAGPAGRPYLYPIPLRGPLPDVPVPLRPTDEPAALPLQSMLAAVYDDGRHAKRIDYRRPPRPRLAAADADWAAVVVRGRNGQVSAN